VEQKNRTLVEMTRMMLDEHGTPRRFWADAISTSCARFLLTPFELRFGRKSSVSHFRPFGCKCFVLKCGNLDKLSLARSMAFCLDTPLMVDPIEFIVLRLTPLLSHVM
jgi:hypothetical protein